MPHALSSYLSRSRLRQRVGIAAPAIVCSLIDSMCTLAGQPAASRGDSSAAVEGNPMFAWLLHISPLAFVAGEVVWCALIVVAVILLPGPAALVAAVAVSIGHMYGALSWMIVVTPILGLYPVFAVFALAPIVQTYVFLRPRWHAPRS